MEYKVFKIANPNDLKKQCDLLVNSGYEYLISADEPEYKMEADISSALSRHDEGSWIIVSQRGSFDRFLIWTDYQCEIWLKKGMVAVDSIYDIDNVNNN